MQNIRQWFNKPINPPARKTFNAVGCPHKRTKYRPARGVVSAEVGIGDERIFRIIVVFQCQVHRRRNGVFDIAGRTEARANDRIIGILQPFREGMTQQRIVMGLSVFKDGCFKG